MARKNFTTLASVVVHYDRQEPPAKGTYGTEGVPTTFSADSDFVDKLDKCFQELWRVCPLGQAKVITSAGAFVNRPAVAGDNHALGRAFDLDGIFWPSRKFVTLNDGFKGGDRKFYFGVQAILRKHFGVVLDYNFNADHRDHFHLDDSRKLEFDSGARSKVVFLQGALVHVLGLDIGSSGIDGDYGTNTQKALNTALTKLGITGSISTLSVWLEFLSKIAATAFGNTISLSKNVSITQPAADSTLDIASAVTFQGKADSGVTKVQLLAENTWDLGTSPVSTSGDWNISFTFTKGGRREVIAKGFDSSGTQVAQSQVSFVLRTGTLPLVTNTDLLTITQPPTGAKFTLGNTVTFEGTAESGIKAVKLLAEDKFDVGKEVSPDPSGKWTISYTFTVGGKRQIIAKGFNKDGQQVDSEEIEIILTTPSGTSTYTPPVAANRILGTIPSLLLPTSIQITDSLLGGKVIYQLPGKEIYIDADMDIDADGSPNATTIDPCCGQLETSLRYPNGKSVDSEQIPYFVLPGGWYAKKGISLGDIAAVIYNDKVEYAIFADVGPAHKIGEGSIALAQALGHDPLINGIVKVGIDKDVIYIIFPGSGDGTPQDVGAIRSKGEALLKALGGAP